MHSSKHNSIRNSGAGWWVFPTKSKLAQRQLDERYLVRSKHLNQLPVQLKEKKGLYLIWLNEVLHIPNTRLKK